METRRPRDIRGNLIGIGDTIAYPSRQGSSMWLSIGTIIDLKYDPPEDAQIYYDGYWSLCVRPRGGSRSGWGVPVTRVVLLSD